MKHRKSKGLQRSIDTKEILRERELQEARDAENWRLWEEEQWRKEELAEESLIEREDC
jgi:hypothetical protein